MRKTNLKLTPFIGIASVLLLEIKCTQDTPVPQKKIDLSGYWTMPIYWGKFMNDSGRILFDYANLSNNDNDNVMINLDVKNPRFTDYLISQTQSGFSRFPNNLVVNPSRCDSISDSLIIDEVYDYGTGEFLGEFKGKYNYKTGEFDVLFKHAQDCNDKKRPYYYIRQDFEYKTILKRY